MALLPKEKYEALCAAFREKPGNFTYAADAAGVNRRTATKAWKVGYARKVGDKGSTLQPPIRDVLEQERRDNTDPTKIRAAVEEVKRKTAAKVEREVRKDAVKQASTQKTKELAVADAMLASIGGSLQRLHSVSPAIDRLVKRLIEVTDSETKSKKMNVNEAWRLLERYVRLQERVSSTIKQSIDMSRRAAGEPDHIVQMVNGPAHELDKTDAEELLDGDPKRVVEAIKSLVNRNPNEDAQRLLERQRMKAQAAAHEAANQTKH